MTPLAPPTEAEVRKWLDREVSYRAPDSEPDFEQLLAEGYLAQLEKIERLERVLYPKAAAPPLAPPTQAEVKAAILLERERRHWTIDQWRQAAKAEGRDDWPAYSAEVQIAADEAVDALCAAYLAPERS